MRRELGLGQGQLAQLLGVTSMTVSRWEKGEAHPKPVTLTALSELTETACRPFRGLISRNGDPAAAPVCLGRGQRPCPPAIGPRCPAPGPAHEEVNDILRNTAIFSHLDAEPLATVSRLAVERHIKASEFLYHEGDFPRHFYVVAEGIIKILKHSLSGKDFIIAFSGPGEVLGNLALFLGQPRTTSAQALTAARVLTIKNNDFLAFLRRRPELSYEILRHILVIVSGRFTSAISRLTASTGERADQRLADVLFALSLKYGPALSFTREQIAQMAGTTTETAMRFVSRLERMHIVGAPRRKIIILDQMKLRRLIDKLQVISR